MDTLLNGRVKIFQKAGAHKASTDSLLLAAAVSSQDVGKNCKILDVGVGAGAVSLVLLARFPGARAVGIDVLPVDLALQSAEENGFDGRFEAVQADILSYRSGSYDIVVTNPPYYKGRASEVAERATARAEAVPLGDWVAACVRRVANNGVFCIIHKAERLDEILASIVAAGLGAVEVFPLQSFAGEDANRVVVRAKRGSRAPLKLHPFITMHKGENYTAAAKRILQKGESLCQLIRK